MNLLVIHEVNYIAKIVYEFQILPELLSMLGHSVTVIDYDDSWKVNRNVARFQLSTTVYHNTHRAYPEASVTIRRPGMIKLPVLSRVSAALTSGVEIVRTMSQSQFDAVLLYGLPTVGLQALVAARRFRIPIFFRSIDVLNRLVPHGILVPATRALEGIVYRRVDGISCVTPHLQEYIKSFGVAASKIEVLPSGVDTRLFSPGPRNNEWLASWGIGMSDPVVLFMGTIYRFSGLDVVIGGFQTVLDRHPNARLLVVGVGDDQPRLQQLAADKGLKEHVIFTGFQTYALLPDIIRSCDLCINPFELNSITRDILPTKLFQYLACGKPVLMTELPGTLPFLSGPSDGVVYSSAETFVSKLGDLLSDRDAGARLGANALETVKRFEWTSIANSLVHWIETRSKTERRQ